MLSNKEFKEIMSIDKFFTKEDIELCQIGDSINYILISSDKKINFMLDVDRKGSFTLNKIKIQNRLEKNIPLVRLEIDAPEHINPDGGRVSRNHIHIYKEGYGLKWAYDLNKFDKEYFKNIEMFNSLFIDFCEYCNIKIYNLNRLQGVI